MFKLSPHIAIQVKQLEQAHQFYKNVLGFDFKEIRPFESGREAVMQKDGHHFFFFEEVTDKPPGVVFF
jgi:catechol 2,3-dioxygenase-like lactoylglutathione lyase family enzyme